MQKESLPAKTRRILNPRRLAVATGFGVAVFLLVVLALHGVTPGYDPRTQFMSELALLPYGAWMLLAFVGLGLAAAATALNLHANAGPRFLSRLPGILLGLAAVLFLAAGVVTLAVSAQAHVAFVACAFMACGLALYLLPRAIAAFSGAGGYAFSWGLGLVMCGAVAAGDEIILPGIAQRIAAAALLLWFLYVAHQLATHPQMSFNS
ncbi:MAG: DUF998 domain-containing protein [Zoogloeaceae bacterium]|jgi:hypothetical protein|nr:DUF998 domain-containing protein [Zoogloeaceae bacterium]